MLRKSILHQDNVAISVNNDQVQCIFFQEGLEEHPPHHPKDQPELQGENPVRKR